MDQRLEWALVHPDKALADDHLIWLIPSPARTRFLEKMALRRNAGIRTVSIMAISRKRFGIAMTKGARTTSRMAATCGLFLLMAALPLAAAEVGPQSCDAAEPDSLQINWTAPCRDGSWSLDPQAGCRLWDWRPEPEDTVTWSGACLSGRKDGRGVAQWYEHGRPIDRFEGVFRLGKRQGFGRYDWPAGQRYQGAYEADLPNGPGTVTIDGASFTGSWRRGCLVHGAKRIAIGVPLSSCGSGPVVDRVQ
jgi:hypothetical protein